MRCHHWLLTTSLLIAASGQAQNLVTNGTFDSNVNGWTSFSPNVGIAWRAIDADGSPTSGSLLATNNSPTALDSGFAQCVNGLTGGTLYSLGVKMLIPSNNPRGRSSLQFQWHNQSNCGGSLLSVDVLETTVLDSWAAVSGDVSSPAGAVSVAVVGEVFKNASNTTLYKTWFDDITLQLSGGTPSSCMPSDTTLCIDDQPGDKRFQVTGSWTTPNVGSGSGNAHAVPLASLGISHGGILWFFSLDNPEMLVKILNGCSLNQKHWVFFAADTNVGFTVDVTDTKTGAERIYFNPLNNAAGPLQDTGAFDCP
jgi:hypothetical protein